MLLRYFNMHQNKIKIIAEIGINHNGDINIAKKMIDLASFAGCDYVKFQKRDPDLAVPDNQKNILKKNTPWGDLTYLEYKKIIEFSYDDYSEIDNYCKKKNISWFASAWDINSVNFLLKFSNEIVKVPSAQINNVELCKFIKGKFKKVIISTGMSDEKQITNTIELLDPNVVMHTLSTYPSPINELNLNYIKYLMDKYKDKEIGYSGHEYGLVTTFVAAGIGAKWIERHVTLDRHMWGSDQLSSIEPSGLLKLVNGIRNIELSLGSYGPRKVIGSEKEKAKSLRIK